MRAYCQIAVSEPLHALRGDHFVLRDETAQRTLGGGIVLRARCAEAQAQRPALLERC